MLYFIFNLFLILITVHSLRSWPDLHFTTSCIPLLKFKENLESRNNTIQYIVFPLQRYLHLTWISVLLVGCMMNYFCICFASEQKNYNQMWWGISWPKTDNLKNSPVSYMIPWVSHGTLQEIHVKFIWLLLGMSKNCYSRLLR